MRQAEDRKLLAHSQGIFDTLEIRKSFSMDVNHKSHFYLILKQYRKCKSFTLADSKAHYFCNIKCSVVPHVSDSDISKQPNLEH